MNEELRKWIMELFAEEKELTVTDIVNRSEHQADQVKKELEQMEKQGLVSKLGRRKYIPLFSMNGLDNPLVPKSEVYHDWSDIVSKLKHCHEHKINCLIIGSKGIGKTSAIRKVAELVGKPIRTVNFSLRTREHHFIGRLDTDENGNLYFKEGPLIKSMKEGGILYLDEINTSSPEVLVRLDEALDYRRELNVEGQRVKAHEDWWTVASINPLDRYHTGTRELPGQLISRFPVRIHMEYPDASCYSDDTEVLTYNGFKLFKNLTYNDEIATLNKNGFIEYHKPTKIWKERYIGPMLHLKQRNVDLLVTPQHRHYVRKDWGNDRKYIRKPLKDMIGAVNWNQKRNAGWIGKDENSLIIPKLKNRYGNERELDTQIIRHNINDWLFFFGAYLAEGSCFMNDEAYIIQLATPTKNQNIKNKIFRDKIKKSLDALNIHHFDLSGEKDGYIRIGNKHLYQILKPLGCAQEKYIPKQYLNLNPELLHCLLDGLMFGDGDMRYSQYTTTSKELRDDVMELMLKCGYGTCHSKPYHSKSKYNGRIIKSNHPTYNVYLSKKSVEPRITKNCIKNTYYDGYWYDVTVPNHVIYVRRNGKTVWSGNTEYKIVKMHVPGVSKYASRFMELLFAIEQLRKTDLPYIPSVRESIALARLLVSGVNEKLAVKMTLIDVYYQFGGEVAQSVTDLLHSRGVEVDN